MVAVWEYRIVLPFTIEEYKIAQLYMVAKFSASESSGRTGDGVEVLKNEPFEDGDRRGQYTHKLYHLASKLPSWLASLLPKTALMLEEEAWNAYPHCTTVLRCPYFNKFRLILETTHVADRGNTENALNLDLKTLKKRQVEYIDIAMDPVETYVEEEDPTKFKSNRTGRGPLRDGWMLKVEPVMCAYKCVTVDVPYWGFGTRIEKFISGNAQRKILLEGHRKCFCWLDEWHGLTMEAIRRMEYETAEAMSRARALALQRVSQAGIEGFDRQDDWLDDLEIVSAVARSLGAEELPLTPRVGTPKLLSRSNTPLSRSNTPRAKDSPSLLKRPSLVGPSFSVGIATLSASDVDDFNLGGSAPPMPVTQWSSRSAKNATSQAKNTEGSWLTEDLKLRSESCESLESLISRSGIEDISSVVEDSQDVSQCVDVLDRAITWTKARAKTGAVAGTKARGKIMPLETSHSASTLTKGMKDVNHCVGVLDTACAVVRRKPSKIKLWCDGALVSTH